MDTELLRKGLEEAQTAYETLGEKLAEVTNLLTEKKTGGRKKTSTRKKTETKDDEPEVTKEDALASLRQIVDRTGDNDVIVKIMKDVAKAKKFSQVKAEFYPAIVEAAQTWLDENPEEDEEEALA